MRAWRWTLLAVVLLATACGDAGSTAAPTTSPTRDPSPEGKSGWPKLGGAAIECVYDYPGDLVDRPIAFDGTVEGVHFDPYDENAGARPARVEMRLNEVFRGDIDGFIVMRSWDFMVPGDEIVGTRVLAAAEHTLDLMACGFTRPYSREEADMWRSTFADAPPEDCGTEVLDCSLGEPTPVPASCERESQEYAVYSEIDGGGSFEVIGCNQRHMSLRLDFGDCPPEATDEEREECAQAKTAYFEARDGRWELITYEDRTSCASVQELEPTFPTKFCDG